MFSFHHLLVPVDFGPATAPAIDLAVSLARQARSRITLVHACDLTRFSGLGDAASPLDIESLVASSKRELDTLLETVRQQWPTSDAVLCRAPACETILEAATACGCDLIVLGTRGRRGLARILLGSVAEKIVRLATIPVLTVHPPQSGDRDVHAA